MNIVFVPVPFLKDHGRPVSVSIVDSGFSSIPSYARVFGRNPNPSHPHGNRVLSIFTALDAQFPIGKLSLNLSCYHTKDGYEGLEYAIGLLPESDILSLSLSWKDDNRKLQGLLFKKASIVLAADGAGTSRPYPSAYGGIQSCASYSSTGGVFSICPVPQWRGNSYAVPAIARLMAYGSDGRLWDDGEHLNDAHIRVQDLFSGAIRGIQMKERTFDDRPSAVITCRHCLRVIRDEKNELVSKPPSKCPYCGWRFSWKTT